MGAIYRAIYRAIYGCVNIYIYIYIYVYVYVYICRVLCLKVFLRRVVSPLAQSSKSLCTESYAGNPIAVLYQPRPLGFSLAASSGRLTSGTCKLSVYVFLMNYSCLCYLCFSSIEPGSSEASPDHNRVQVRIESRSSIKPRRSASSPGS